MYLWMSYIRNYVYTVYVRDSHVGETDHYLLTTSNYVQHMIKMYQALSLLTPLAYTQSLIIVQGGEPGYEATLFHTLPHMCLSLLSYHSLHGHMSLFVLMYIWLS